MVDAWFPRSIDDEAGGFWAEHDVRWRRRGDGHRMLEFQARQTRTAARLGLAFPTEAERWRSMALHGFSQLRESMSDRAEGGWFWLASRDGQPLYGGTKHAHGISYLLSACVAVYKLTADPRALAMADEAFEWLETAHHDDEHGGYHGWVTRDGRPILATDDVPPGVTAREPLGHAIGLKDANVTGDVLEAYRLLASQKPSERALARMRELYEIFDRRLITPAGAIHYIAHVDWVPVPTLVRYGYLVQQTPRLAGAAAIVGDVQAGLALARRLTGHVLERGWDDRRSAIVVAGTGAEPDRLGRRSLRVPDVEWWTQAEALRALVFLAVNDPSSERWRTYLERMLGGIERGLLDRRHGGWHYRPVRDVAWRRRLRGEPPKGTDWKDASHEADVYLAAIRMLRGLPEDAPLE